MVQAHTIKANNDLATDCINKQTKKKQEILFIYIFQFKTDEMQINRQKLMDHKNLNCQHIYNQKIQLEKYETI